MGPADCLAEWCPRMIPQTVVQAFGAVRRLLGRDGAVLTLCADPCLLVSPKFNRVGVFVAL